MSQTGFAVPVLEIHDLIVRFPGSRQALWRRRQPVSAVDGVSLVLQPGETLGLVGESGSGKSTLARAIVGLSPIHSGRVMVEGANAMESLRTAPRAFRRQVQMVFQDPYASLSPRQSVSAILLEPLKIHGLLEGNGSGQVDSLLSLVGLPSELKHRKAKELSGGQSQRVALARALALDPRLIICDEPTSALDVSVQAQILNLLVELRERLGVSYLFIGHDLAVIRQIAHRVVVMYAGRIVEEGTTEETFSEPQHPYTLALLSAAPVADPEIERSKLRISLPDLGNDQQAGMGCRFRPRCWLWKKLGEPRQCIETEPELLLHQSGQTRSACHFSDHSRAALHEALRASSRPRIVAT